MKFEAWWKERFKNYSALEHEVNQYMMTGRQVREAFNAGRKAGMEEAAEIAETKPYEKHQATSARLAADFIRKAIEGDSK